MKNARLLILATACICFGLYEEAIAVQNYQKENEEKSFELDRIKVISNPYRKFKEPKRKFVNKFNKNNHRK